MHGHVMLDVFISHSYLTSNMPVTHVQSCENQQ